MMKYFALTATDAVNPWGPEVWDAIPAFDSERLVLAGQVTLIGMLMIFSVLAILWAVLVISAKIFAKPAQSAKPAPAPKAAPAPKTAPVVCAPAASNDAELVAVLTAAVAAYMASENPGTSPSGFRVVSYRRTNGGKPWNSK